LVAYKKMYIISEPKQEREREIDRKRILLFSFEIQSRAKKVIISLSLKYIKTILEDF